MNQPQEKLSPVFDLFLNYPLNISKVEIGKEWAKRKEKRELK